MAMMPRVCMPTARLFARRAFQCGLYEAQDVLCETDDVDLICLQPKREFRVKQSWQRRLLYHDVSKRLIFVNPGLERVRLTHDYELFVAVCQNYWDLLCINAIDDWKSHCRTSVIWIDEIWAEAIPKYKYWLHALRRFDHIFVGCQSSVGALSNAVGRPCAWLPGGADMMRFSPYPNPPARVVDVYSIGRRSEGIHRALLPLAASKRFFYVHDTCGGADMEALDHRQHRDVFANLAKRSRYFVVSPARMEGSEGTRGQIEIGYRYYEGCAAGAVMIGQSPPCEAFTQMFGWSGAVVHIEPDGSDVVEVLSSLDARPDRFEALGRRNATEALLRHDWIYRWQQMYRAAGIDPSIAMTSRAHRLREIASEANRSAAGPRRSHGLRSVL